MYGHLCMIISTIAGEHNLNAVSLLVHTPSRATEQCSTSLCEPYLQSVWNKPGERQHFLTERQPLHKPRDRFLKKIQSITEVDIGNMVPMCDVTQLILDPSLLFTSETIID